MSKDKVLGLGLSAISLLLGVGTVIFFLIYGGYVSMVQFTWPALGFLIGTAVFFFSFLEGGLRIDDEIEAFPDLIQDDIEDFRSGRITTTHLLVVGTLVAAAIELVILLWMKKINAFWGPLNVMLVAFIVVALTMVLTLRSNWFQNRQRRLPIFYYAIPAIGWLICLAVGPIYADPPDWRQTANLERSQAVASAATEPQASNPDGTFYFIGRAGSMFTDFDCDDEGCLLLLLIFIVAISVLASATIPHFWVVATMLLLTLMAMIALRELLYRDFAD